MIETLEEYEATQKTVVAELTQAHHITLFGKAAGGVNPGVIEEILEFTGIHAVNGARR